jgi:acetylornithine deacetylase/succinyl-diaminopimelate desuccinylase-like protein
VANRLRADVEALAGIERRSASEGEERSAAWLAERMEDAGAAGVEVRRFRYQHSFAPAQSAHFAAALVGAVTGRRALAAGALLSFELEYSGRSQWLRRVLPGGEGATVTGRIPARGEHRRTLVLVAHHDAAQTGLMWHPALVGAARGPFSAPVELAMAAAALGARRVPVLLLAAALALSVDAARGATVPGANDNASGVAAVLALVERLAADPLGDTEVVAVLPGCEESGMGGMADWLRDARPSLDPARSLVLGLDTIGCGEPVVLEAEGPLWSVRYRDEDLALADRGAELAGLGPLRRFRAGGWTDPVLARLAGLPAISLLSVKGDGFTNYHLPSDTPERVDWDSVERCLVIAESVARAWAA